MTMASPEALSLSAGVHDMLYLLVFWAEVGLNKIRVSVLCCVCFSRSCALVTFPFAFVLCPLPSLILASLATKKLQSFINRRMDFATGSSDGAPISYFCSSMIHPGGPAGKEAPAPNHPPHVWSSDGAFC